MAKINYRMFFKYTALEHANNAFLKKNMIKFAFNINRSYIYTEHPNIIRIFLLKRSIFLNLNREKV